MISREDFEELRRCAERVNAQSASLHVSVYSERLAFLAAAYIDSAGASKSRDIYACGSSVAEALGKFRELVDEQASKTWTHEQVGRALGIPPAAA